MTTLHKDHTSDMSSYVVLYTTETLPSDEEIDEIHPPGRMSFYVGGGGWTGSEVTAVESVGAVPVDTSHVESGATYPSGRARYRVVDLVPGAELLVRSFYYDGQGRSRESVQRIRCDADAAQRYAMVMLSRARTEVTEIERRIAWATARDDIAPVRWEIERLPRLRAEVERLEALSQ